MNNIKKLVEDYEIKMKKMGFFLLSILLCISCAETSQKMDSQTQVVVYSDSFKKSDNLVNENKTLDSQEKRDSLNNDVMKANLTKEEEAIIRTIEKKYNDCMKKVVNQEPVEENLDVFVQNITDFEQYMSVLMESFNRVLMRYGYKTPEESVFQQKLNVVWKLNEREELVYSFKNFKSFYIEPYEVHNTYYFEKALHASDKYRFVLPFCTFLRFDKKIELQNVDSFLPGAVIGDLNSELIIDKKKIEPEIYKNLFLFNNNKAAKVWLMSNDLKFFNRINYFEDREVNEKKLKTYLSTVPHEYDNYEIPVSFAYSDLEDQWNGDDMMDLVYEKTDSAIVAYEFDKRNKLDIKAFDLMTMFLLRYKDKKILHRDSDFVKIACKFARMEISLNKKHAHEEKNGIFNIESSSVSYRLLNDDILELAKKENYFDISDFDEVLKVIEWDKEHDPQGSNDYHPFDYTELIE